ncbi:MAG: hypothetical protein KDK72_06275 [Chlamydiia bacterium]|nr:hypothetical protein [Chlamydiia bacterium]
MNTSISPTTNWEDHKRNFNRGLSLILEAQEKHTLADLFDSEEDMQFWENLAKEIPEMDAQREAQITRYKLVAHRWAIARNLGAVFSLAMLFFDLTGEALELGTLQVQGGQIAAGVVKVSAVSIAVFALAASFFFHWKESQTLGQLEKSIILSYDDVHALKKVIHVIVSLGKLKAAPDLLLETCCEDIKQQPERSPNIPLPKKEEWLPILLDNLDDTNEFTQTAITASSDQEDSEFKIGGQQSPGPQQGARKPFKTKYEAYRKLSSKLGFQPERFAFKRNNINYVVTPPADEVIIGIQERTDPESREL